MFIYLIIYFIGIYLIIAEYAFLPKSINRFYIMLGIHLGFTVPSSFFLAKEVLKRNNLIDNVFYLFIVTIVLSVIAVSLSGLIVKKIRD